MKFSYTIWTNFLKKIVLKIWSANIGTVRYTSIMFKLNTSQHWDSLTRVWFSSSKRTFQQPSSKEQLRIYQRTNHRAIQRTWKFWNVKLIAKLIAEVVAVSWEKLVRASRPFPAEFPYYLIYCQHRAGRFPQHNGLTERVHGIFAWRAAKNPTAMFTVTKWPFFVPIHLLSHMQNELITSYPS